MSPVVLFVPANTPKKAFFKVGSNLAAFVLFAFILNGTLSLVPIKLVPSTVPLFPNRFQKVPPPTLPGACQVAFPKASEVNILPALKAPPVTCKPPEINFALVPVPA